MGDAKGGPFDIPGDLAREWLRLPANPNGRTNADVLKPWVNGMDLTRRPAGKWIVDFGLDMSDSDAALYEEPFRWVTGTRLAHAERNPREAERRTQYWLHTWIRDQSMWQRSAACRATSRRLVSPNTGCSSGATRVSVPTQQLIVIARDDDTTFGILHSRFHEIWSLRLGTSLEDRSALHPDHHIRDVPVPQRPIA